MKKDIKPADEPKEESSEPTAEETGSEGIVIPEEFQKAVHHVMKQAKTKHHLSHIRDRVNAHEDAMRKEEMKKDSKGKDKPTEFNSTDMPS